MKFNYYAITGGVPLRLVRERAEQYNAIMRDLKVFKDSFSIRDIYGYHFHAFRRLKILGVSFRSGGTIPSGWVHRKTDPRGIYRPATYTKNGRFNQRMLNALALNEPTGIYAACRCTKYEHNGLAYWPSIGIEGELYMLAVPDADYALHRPVYGLKPMSETEHSEMVCSARTQSMPADAYRGCNELAHDSHCAAEDTP